MINYQYSLGLISEKGDILTKDVYTLTIMCKASRHVIFPTVYCIYLLFVYYHESMYLVVDPTNFCSCK